MAILHLKVNNQTLTASCDIDKIVEDSIKYLQYDLETSEDWNEMTPEVIFTYDGKDITAPDDFVPSYVLRAPGFKVSVNGYVEANKVLVKRITTSPINIGVYPAGALEGTVVTEEELADDWLSKVQAAANAAKTIATAANSKATTANSKATNAVNTANEANTKATNAETNAANALSNSTAALETAIDTQNKVQSLSKEAVKSDKKTAEGGFGKKLHAFNVNPFEQKIEIKLEQKNLFNASRLEGFSTTTGNMTFSYVNKNSFEITTVDGYSGNGYCQTIALKELCPELKAGETYVLSGETQASLTAIHLSPSDVLWYLGESLTLSEQDLGSKVAFYGLNSTSQGIGNCKISNIQIEKGTQVSDYVERQEINGLELEYASKNWFDITKTTGFISANSGVESEIFPEENYILVKNTISSNRIAKLDLGVFPIGYYNISFSSTTLPEGWALKGEDNLAIASPYYNRKKQHLYLAFTTYANQNYIFSDIQVTEGSVPLEYEAGRRGEFSYDENNKNYIDFKGSELIVWTKNNNDAIKIISNYSSSLEDSLHNNSSMSPIEEEERGEIVHLSNVDKKGKISVSFNKEGNLVNLIPYPLPTPPSFSKGGAYLSYQKKRVFTLSTSAGQPTTSTATFTIADTLSLKKNKKYTLKLEGPTNENVRLVLKAKNTETNTEVWIVATSSPTGYKTFTWEDNYEFILLYCQIEPNTALETKCNYFPSLVEGEVPGTFLNASDTDVNYLIETNKNLLDLKDCKLNPSRTLLRGETVSVLNFTTTNYFDIELPEYLTNLLRGRTVTFSVKGWAPKAINQSIIWYSLKNPIRTEPYTTSAAYLEYSNTGTEMKITFPDQPCIRALWRPMKTAAVGDSKKTVLYDLQIEFDDFSPYEKHIGQKIPCFSNGCVPDFEPINEELMIYGSENNMHLTVKYKENIDKIKDNISNALKGIESNHFIHLEDASPIKHDMKIRVSGKNLLDKQYFRPMSSNSKFTISGDTISFTPNANYYAIRIDNKFIGLQKGKTYTFSGNYTGAHGNSWGWVIFYKDGTKTNSSNSSSLTIKIEKEVTVIAFYVGYNFNLTSAATLSNVQIELGSTATTYENYVNPSTISVINHRKNLLTQPYIHSNGRTHRGITYTVYADGRIKATGTATGGPSWFSLNEIYNLPSDDIICTDCSYTPGNNLASIYISEGETVDKTYYPQIEFGIATDYEEPQKALLYTPDKYGFCEIPSLSSAISLSTNKTGAIINCEYNKDVTKVIEQLTNAIIALGGNI